MMEENLDNHDVDTEGAEMPSASADPALMGMPVQKQLFVLTGVLALMFAVGGVSVYIVGQRDNDDPNGQPMPETIVIQTDDTDTAVTFSNMELLAESALVVDVRSGEILYSKEPDLKWPLASITKLMTALVAKEIIAEGSVVPITAAALGQSGDSGLALNERFAYERLSDLVLLMSSNDGAYALSAAAGSALDPASPEEAFVKAMNVRARELGLKSTSFRNPTGLDVGVEEAGAYGTARDVASLMTYIVLNYQELLEETTAGEAFIKSEGGTVHKAPNTNRVVGEIAKVIGSKTGFTTLSGGNLVVAFDAGLDRPVVAVVLGSSYQGRFSDIVKLTAATLNELNSHNQ